VEAYYDGLCRTRKSRRDAYESENENNEGREKRLREEEQKRRSKKADRMEDGKNKKGTKRTNRSKGRSDELCNELEGVLTIGKHMSKDGRGTAIHCYMYLSSRRLTISRMGEEI
jgi:hypothetical protein